MFKTAAAVLAAVIALGVTASHASTIANRDTTAHKLVVVQGQSRTEFDLQPSDQLDALCPNTCELYVGTDPEPYELLAGDRLFIEGGEVFFEEDSNTENAPAQDDPPAQ